MGWRCYQKVAHTGQKYIFSSSLHSYLPIVLPPSWCHPLACSGDIHICFVQIPAPTHPKSLFTSLLCLSHLLRFKHVFKVQHVATHTIKVRWWVHALISAVMSRFGQDWSAWVERPTVCVKLYPIASSTDEVTQFKFSQSSQSLKRPKSSLFNSSHRQWEVRIWLQWVRYI